MPRAQSKAMRLKRHIIVRWRIASRVRASPARSAGLGWSSGSHLRLDWALKNTERAARRRSVERNLNSAQMRCEFLRYPYHCLSGAISSVQNCAEAPGATAGQED